MRLNDIKLQKQNRKREKLKLQSEKQFQLNIESSRNEFDTVQDSLVNQSIAFENSKVNQCAGKNLVLPQNLKGNNNFNKFEEKKKSEMVISPKKTVKKQAVFAGSTLKTKRIVEIDLNNDHLKLNQMSGIKIPLS